MTKLFRSAAIATLVLTPAYGFSAASAPVVGISSGQTVEHGGGCRKSSPPGKCCHMDNSTGRVHCH